MVEKRPFEEIVQATQERLDALRNVFEGFREKPDRHFEEALEQLSVSLEGMRAAQEELEQRNEQLASASATLEQERRRYQELFDFAPDGYLITDTNGTIQQANHAAARLLAVRQDFLIGKPLIVFVERKMHNEFLAHLTRLLKEAPPAPERWEIDIQPREGTAIPAAIRAALVQDLEGRPTGIRWSIRDFTVVKQREVELRRLSEQMRALVLQLEAVREEERTRLARELHDEFSSALTALKLDLGWVTRQIPKDLTSVFDRIKEMFEIIDKSIAALHQTTFTLRPRELDDFGLVAAMESLIEEFQAQTEIQCEAVLPEKVALEGEPSTVVFRIFQECLRNIASHAAATRVEINLREEPDILVLEVRDNGVGLEKNEIEDPKSLGLLGMQERASSLGGELHFERPEEGGTMIKLNSPIRKAGAS